MRDVAQIALAFGGGLSLLGIALSPVLAVPALTLLAPGLFAGLSKRVIYWCESVSEALINLALWAVLAMTAVQFAVVMLRYLFGIGISWLNESIFYFHASLFLLSAAAALKVGAHVRIDVFFTKFSASQKAMTELIGVHLALWPMMILILSAGNGYLTTAWRVLERSSQSDGLPFVYLFKTLLPIFAMSLILQGLANSARAALSLVGAAPDPMPVTIAQPSEEEGKTRA